MNKLRNIIKVLLPTVVCLMVAACGKEDVAQPSNRITTDEVVDISHRTAKCVATVDVENVNNYTEMGVCLSTEPNPTRGDKRFTLNIKNGRNATILTGLRAGTEYYVRGYVVGKNSGNTFYGTEISFKTPEVEAPTVETSWVKDVGTNRATCGGKVEYDGGADITEKGICWSTSPNPTIEDNHLASDGDNGNIEVNITGLSNFTTYYVRAYANNGTHIGYSDAVKITTNGFIAGREFADLGLPSGLKWATYNVGATSPEQYGYYYAWGEITTKETYTIDNCITYGQEIGDISGNPTYDVARANSNWGSTWRMPTITEIQELRNNCTWTWTKQNGVNGMKVVGKNGSNIFLPAAGYCRESLHYNVGSYSYYWSSTPQAGSIIRAGCLQFLPNGNNHMSWFDRSLGHSVRPVSD